MAKVLVSMPDELLERLDARARDLGETRSGQLQRLVERDLDEADGEWRRRRDELIEAVRGAEPEVRPVPHVDSARLIREDRESH